MQIIMLSKEKVLDYLVWINKVIQLYYIIINKILMKI